jgi:hypothetical protein
LGKAKPYILSDNNNYLKGSSTINLFRFFSVIRITLILYR